MVIETEIIARDTSRPKGEAARDVLTKTSDSVEWLLVAFAVAGTLFYLWPLLDFVNFNADEGVSLAGAERVLRGQVPYRDFFTFVTPGSDYLFAGVFKLFGKSLLAARGVVLFYAAVFAALTYWLTRRVHRPSTSLFAVGLLILGCMTFRFHTVHNWDSTFTAFLAVCCAYRFLDHRKIFWALLVGVATSLTILTEQSKGAGLLLGIAVAIAALYQSRSRFQFRVSHLGGFVFGLLVPIALVAMYFWQHHALAPMLESVLWPFRHYSAVNRVPYGWSANSGIDNFGGLHQAWGSLLFIFFFTAPFVLLPAMAVMTIAMTVHRIVKTKGAPDDSKCEYILGGCIFFGVWLACLATGRLDFNHLLYLAPLFIYLVPGILDIKLSRLKTLYSVRQAVAFLLLLSFAGFGFACSAAARKGRTTLTTRRGTVRIGSNDEVIRFVQNNVADGELLYIHPYQPFYSFMTGTVNPTQFEFLFPGMNTNNQYGDAVQDLDRKRPRAVLLNPDFASEMIPLTWPSTPAEAVASDPVEKYILKHYRHCRVLNANAAAWRFYYMVRNDLVCPN